MPLILVFGTLRKNSTRGYNYGRLGTQHYLRDHELPGYLMYSLGPFPAICLDPSGDLSKKVKCEVHEVDQYTLASIDYMELGAGYRPATIQLAEGPATFYLIPHEWISSFPPILSGDWA